MLIAEKLHQGSDKGMQPGNSVVTSVIEAENESRWNLSSKKYNGTEVEMVARC